MYLGIDIGGTKTLLATISDKGTIKTTRRFPTPKIYKDFLKELAVNVADISTDKFRATCVAAPGRIDREHGIGIGFGNLPWQNVPLRDDLKRIVNCPVVVENDANLAGLSEARLLPQYECVVYVTISTGIGTGIINNGHIDPELADTEGGQIILEHNNKLRTWESFASGKAIVRRYGKRAGEITSQTIWKTISRDIALGLYDLIAFTQPDAVVLGGGVATHLGRFEKLLETELKRFETPLTPIPPILQAQRPEEAVIYGCYELAKDTHGSVGK
jgi:predicted NBD/HSP70 family sugar kinase